jgi:hypothetical protein
MDFIDSFVAESDSIPSPKIYRLWSAITAVSGALERKVWTAGSAGPIFPHLFTILVGPPASGKTNSISRIRDYWARIPTLKLAGDNLTLPALVDAMAAALRTEMFENSILTFSALNITSSEFGVFFMAYDLGFLSFFNNVFDSPLMYREERRTAGNTEVIKPHIVMLAGTQPDYLASFMPETAWGMGFTSRLLLIYCNEAPKKDLFSIDGKAEARSLSPLLNQIHKLKGEMKWTARAKTQINAWHMRNCPPTPTHNKLNHYLGRRALHALKLSMISALSRTQDFIIDIEDFERAQDWLLTAEKFMPDVFHAMSLKSDNQIISDLHFYLYSRWSANTRGQREDLPEAVLYNYLKERVPSEKISRIIEIAEKTGSIKQGKYPGTYIPQPLTKLGD